MTQAPSAKPDHQRPELPDFWDKRFAAGATPWDHGSAPAELEALLPPPASATPPRILVPGCGHAREAAWLDQRGWAVTALDFAPAAIAAGRLRGRMGVGQRLGDAVPGLGRPRRGEPGGRGVGAIADALEHIDPVLDGAANLTGGGGGDWARIGHGGLSLLAGRTLVARPSDDQEWRLCNRRRSN